MPQETYDDPSSALERRTPLDWAYALAFGVLICLPIVGGFLGIGTFADTEKRVPSPFPEWRPTEEELAQAESEIECYLDSFRSFPAEFNAYYNDQFGFRTSLIHAHSLLKFFWLGIPPTPRVVVGEDDWLYFNSQGNIESYRGTRLYTRKELEKWALRLAEIQEWLDDRDVDYLLVVSPSKTTIYPEHLPSWVRKVSGQTRFDQLVRFLAEETDVELVDLRQDLLDSKPIARSYLKYDSHWSMFGGFVSYRAVAERLQQDYPAIELLDEDDFVFEEQERKGGDLATILHLVDELREVETKLIWKEEQPYSWSAGSDLLPPTLPDREVNQYRRLPSVTVNEREGLPELLMFHDSFGPIIIRYLASATSRGVYYWQLMPNPEVVDREKPDIVVHELGERLLMMRRIGKTPAEISRSFGLRRRYRAKGRSLGRIEEQELPVGETVLDVPIELDGKRTTLLRIDLDLEGPALLRVLRGEGAHEVLRRRLRLEREIDYVELRGLEPGELVRIVIEIEGGGGAVRSVEART